MQATLPGARAAAFCDSCRRIVRTRAEYHTVRLSRTRLSVPHVLVTVCDECETVLEIPRESMPQLRAIGAA